MHLDVVLDETHAVIIAAQQIVERVGLNLVGRPQGLALISELDARQIVRLTAVLVGWHLHHHAAVLVEERAAQRADVADIQARQVGSQDVDVAGIGSMLKTSAFGPAHLARNVL